MKICYLVLNYNGHQFLKNIDEAKSMCDKNAIDLIIADDGSTDASTQYLKKNKYDITVNSGENKGFAANANNGIKYANSKTDYDFYIIANNDIEIKSGFFEDALPKAIEQIYTMDKTPGIIGFDEILIDRDLYFRSYKYEQHRSENILSLNEIPGFFFMISKELIQQIGLLDEEYFMYGEDNDYFSRTIKAGFKIYNTYLPVRHYSEGSSSNGKKTSWYVYRNAFLYAQKNNGIKGVLSILVSFLWKIYNPFYKSNHPSNLRVIRNGFFYNNYLLLKSLKWNLQYYLKNKYKHE